MALFVNNGDEHVTIPDGCGGALIVPAGCEVVEGPDGALVARPRGTREADPADGQALPPIDESAYPPDAVPVPVDDPGPFADAPADEVVVEVDLAMAERLGIVPDGTTALLAEPDGTDAPVMAPPLDEPATTKRRRGGTPA